MLQKKAAQRCGEVSIVLAFVSIVISSYSLCSDYARNALRFGCVVYARFATPTPSMPSMPSTHTPHARACNTGAITMHQLERLKWPLLGDTAVDDDQIQTPLLF